MAKVAKKQSRSQRSWREKLADDRDLPKIAVIPKSLSKRMGGTGKFVIPTPREVDAAMKKIPSGKLTTMEALRKSLAKKHRTATACAVTTGIFAWIAAHAANEAEAEGVKRITPYWRTLKTGGALNPKYPGGLKALAARLKAEGHTVVVRGKRWVVADYEKSVVEPSL
jgi:hypothetical protein